MKRILALLTVLLFVNACDDGDLTVENIDFSEITPEKCDNKEVLYKIKDSEILILSIPMSNFANDETPDNDPIEVEIDGDDVQVIYRQYSGNVSENNICPEVPAATPNVIEEWNATSGIVEITSTAIKSVNTTTGITQITGYNHNIVLKSINFQKSNGTDQTYETYPFGNYNTTSSPLAFGFTQEGDKCGNQVFKVNSSEAFVLDLADYSTLFANVETTTPRTAYISATNKVSYKLYSGTVNSSVICAATPPATPTLNKTWTANNGDATAGTGIIEVTTTTSSPGFYLHTIRLKKVTMSWSNSDFYLGDDYLYGTIITP